MKFEIIKLSHVIYIETETYRNKNKQKGRKNMLKTQIYMKRKCYYYSNNNLHSSYAPIN